MTFATSGGFGFGELGTGPPNQQDDNRIETFPECSNFFQTLVAQGVYDSASYSLWLNPSLGSNDSVDESPPGIFTIGGIDTALFTGPLTTLPTVADNSTTVISAPEHWNLALSALQLANGTENLVAETVSCVIHTGASVLFLPEDTFNKVIAHFQDAVLNATTGIYQLPCSERLNSRNSPTFSFSDPRYLGAQDQKQRTSRSPFLHRKRSGLPPEWLLVAIR
jgi:hypothetical protein